MRDSLGLSWFVRTPRVCPGALQTLQNAQKVHRKWYQALVINSAPKRDSIGVLDPNRELAGDSEMVYFSSFDSIYINNEPNY